MGILDSIFGKKSKTNQTSTTNESVTPIMDPNLAALMPLLGERLGDLLRANPADFVAGLSDLERRGMTGIGALADNPYFDDRGNEALSYLRTGADMSRGYTPVNTWGQGVNMSQHAQQALARFQTPENIERSALHDLDMRGSEQERALLGFNPDVMMIDPSSMMADSDYYGRSGNVSAGGLNALEIQSRMSPYIDAVINPTLDRIDLQHGIQSAQSRARRAGQKAFGSQGAKAEQYEQYLQNLERNEIIPKLYQQGYESAAALGTSDLNRALEAARANQSTRLGELGIEGNIDTSNIGAMLEAARANQSSALEGSRIRQQALTSSGQMALNANDQRMQALNAAANAALEGSRQRIGATSEAGQQGLTQQQLQQQAEGTNINAALGAGRNMMDAGVHTSAVNDANFNRQLQILQGLFGAGQTQRDIDQRRLDSPWTQVSNLSNILFSSPMGQQGTSTSTGTGSTTSRGSLFDIVTGIAKAGAGMGFARGGAVPAIPALRPMSKMVMGNRDANAALWEDMYDSTQDMGRGIIDAEYEVVGDEGMNDGPMLDFAIYRPQSRPSPALDMNFVSSAQAQDDMGGALVTNPGPMGGEKIDDDLMTREAQYVPTLNPPAYLTEAALGSDGFDPMASPRLEASSPRDLMSNTLAALSQEVKRPKKFLDRVNEFLNKDSTVEGFAVFSEGWRGVAERRAEAKKQAIQAAALEQEAALKAEELDIKRMGLQKDMAVTAQGLFAGDSVEAQKMNTILRQYAPGPQRDNARLELLRRMYGKPMFQTMPDGTMIQMPGVDITNLSGGAALSEDQGAGVGQGVGAAGPQELSTKPMERESAFFVASIPSIQADLDIVENTFFDKSDPNNPQLRESAVIASSLPKSEASSAKQAIRRVIEIVLRARTGAAAPASEVENYVEMYSPSVNDSDAAAWTKIQRLRELFDGARALMETGRSRSIVPPNQSGAALEEEVIDFDNY